MTEKPSKRFEGIRIYEDRIRTEVDPNFYAYLLIENKKMLIGELPEDFDVALAEQEIHGTEISEPKLRIPIGVRRLYNAFNSVCPPWNLYLLPIYTKHTRKDAENIITDWLSKNQYNATVFIVNTPKIIERKLVKEIPMNGDTFTRIIEDSMKKRRIEKVMHVGADEK